MSESTNLISSPCQSTKSLPISFHQQLVLIYQNFRNLKTKYEYDGTWVPSQSINSIENNQERWNKRLHRLKFKNLPLLRQHINALPRLLSGFKQDTNGSKLQLMIGTQSELDQNLDQITSIAASIKPPSLSSPARTDDSDLQELKEFKLQKLFYSVKFLTHELCLIFDFFASSMQQSNRPKGVNHKRRVIQLLIVANKSITRLIDWLNNHEFMLIQESWTKDLGMFDDQITRLTKLINKATNPAQIEDEHEDLFSTNHPHLNEEAIPLAQSIIPIIKLSRLFFKKLAQNVLNQIPSKSYTDMNSYQLGALSQSIGLITGDVRDIIDIVGEANATHQAETDETLTESIQKIVHRFDSVILLVIVYVIPLLPNQNISPPNPLQAYFVHWNNLFLTATQNCIQAAQSLKSPPSSPQIDPINLILSLRLM